jgi:hypothetical protein
VASPAATPVLSRVLDGPSGLPFLPMAGGLGRRRRAERLTWLSEDDEVWGTRAVAGSGVVGDAAAGLGGPAGDSQTGESASPAGYEGGAVVGRPTEPADHDAAAPHGG